MNDLSWGLYPSATHTIRTLYWRDEALSLRPEERVLPRGQGRSYGDSCLNDGGVLLSTRLLDRFINFDKTHGILRCEAGITLKDILMVIVPAGWFLPVTPGTQWVSLGGAIAHDVHGKNHPTAGTLGCYVRCFELLRSDGQRYLCSPTENVELFSATIGGIGLTGLITWAEIQLKPIAQASLSVDRTVFNNIPALFQRLDDMTHHEYAVAWLDLQASGDHFGRGILTRANHADEKLNRTSLFSQSTRKWGVRVLYPFTIKLFNDYYHRKQSTQPTSVLQHYTEFFYPLDRFSYWNKLYGKRGFLQYQCVIPHAVAFDLLLEKMMVAKIFPYLSVLKMLGQQSSPAMMSFTKPGINVAFDFPNVGEKTFALLRALDKIVVEQGGSIYLAKDARMSPEVFAACYPKVNIFAEYIDPAFSSSLWRRVRRC